MASIWDYLPAPGSGRPYLERAGREIWRFIPPELRGKVQATSEVTQMLTPGSGTVQASLDAPQVAQDFRDGNYGDAALGTTMGILGTVADWVPPAKLAMAAATRSGKGILGRGPRGPSGPDLPMDEASRFARAKELGYDDARFFRGERAGDTPQEFPYGAYFSRDYDYAAGFARKGGKESPQEYRLNLERVFHYEKPLTAEAYGRLVAAARETDPKLAADMVDSIAPGKGIDWFIGFSQALPDMIVHRSPKLLYNAIENNARKPMDLMLRAGFDAVDSGRDVHKFDGFGIRSKDAAFDPARARDRNIMASLLAGLGAGSAAAFGSASMSPPPTDPNTE